MGVTKRNTITKHIAPTSSTISSLSSTANTLPENVLYKEKKINAIIKKFDFINHEDDIVEASIMRLHKLDPTQSALKILSLSQKIIMISSLIIFLAALLAYPILTFIIINLFTTLYFLSAIFFRIFLMAKSLNTDDKKLLTHHYKDDKDLPIVTIILPLRDEQESLPILVNALAKLDYPQDKLDIKLVLEEDDLKTQNEARNLNLYTLYDVIIVPVNQPRTKPKACNQALYHALGDYTVIYDAEDQPEPDQLRKAIAAFKASDDNVACVQARLNYYNANDNWLTKLFTLEYSLWFDSFLPALEKMNIPIPLGGTSNIFRTDILIKLGGWDPFNVTEDADLGLRLAVNGYKTIIINSTTYEEANCDLKNWLRQRSRWMKGYIQTWLVHMRKPTKMIKTVGISGFLGTQLFLAGNVFSALINPILWLVFLSWHITHAPLISQIFPGPLLYLNLFALLFGNFFFIYLFIIAPLKRGWVHLTTAAFLAPIYWSLSAIAAYKAVWQLFTKPFYWEKTQHHISKTAIAHRHEILMASTQNNIRPKP